MRRAQSQLHLPLRTSIENLKPRVKNILKLLMHQMKILVMARQLVPPGARLLAEKNELSGLL
jgi:hypothetical protein